MSFSPHLPRKIPIFDPLVEPRKKANKSIVLKAFASGRVGSVGSDFNNFYILSNK